jgi:zinc protease
MPRLPKLSSFSVVRIGTTFLFLALLAPFSFAATPQKFATSQPTEFRLANGLQVVLIPDHRTPVVTHSIWYKVGATDDPPHSHGLAHFLEHMMFKGTDKFPGGAFNEVISRIGGTQNAFTTDSMTYYFQIVPKAHLKQIMEMEADRMTNLRMYESEVMSERAVILQERRSVVDDNFKRRLFIEAYEALYGSHPLNTDLIGSQDEILSFSRDEALAFYRRHYAPGNAVLVIAGDISEAELRPLVELTYGRIPSKEVPAERPIFSPLPASLGAKSVSITDAHVVTPTIWLLFRMPGWQQMELREIAALSILKEIIGSDTGRLQQTRVRPGMALEAASEFETGLASRFVVGANTAGNVGLAQIKNGLNQTIAGIVAKGVTQEELDLERASFLAAEIYSMDYQPLLAANYGRSLALGMSIENIPRWIDEIKAVRVEDIQAAARKYLIEDMKLTAEAWPPNTASTGTDSPPAEGPK